MVVPRLFHLDFNPADKSFVPFLVLLHIGTATALLILYRDEWARMIAGFVRATARGEVRGDDERLAVLLIVGTIPAGILGVVFEERIKSLFTSGRPAAIFLMCNAGILLGAEALRRRAERRAGVESASRAAQEEVFTAAPRLSVRAAVLVGSC